MGTGPNSEGVNDYINSRCVVTFRPHLGWNGEYGFDWYRNGDFEEFDGKGENTKVPFSYDNRFKRFYPLLEVKNGSDIIDEYCVPYMLLEKGKTVDLNITIKAQQGVTHLLFVSRNYRLRLKGKDITNQIINKSDLSSNIIISVDTARVVENDEPINVYSINYNNIRNKVSFKLNGQNKLDYHNIEKKDYSTFMAEKELAGRLILLGNKTHSIFIQYVNVENDFSYSACHPPIDANRFSELDESVNIILQQAGIRISSIPTTITIPLPKNPLLAEGISQVISRDNSMMQQQMNEWYLLEANEDEDSNTLKERKQRIIDRLQKKRSSCVSPANPWLITVFMVPVTCTIRKVSMTCARKEELKGLTSPCWDERSNFKIKSISDIVIFTGNTEEFNTNGIAKTLAHEISHNCGLNEIFMPITLPPTLEEKDRITRTIKIREGTTNNLMDYRPYGKILWNWQWKRARDNAKIIETKYMTGINRVIANKVKKKKAKNN